MIVTVLIVGAIVAVTTAACVALSATIEAAEVRAAAPPKPLAGCTPRADLWDTRVNFWIWRGYMVPRGFEYIGDVSGGVEPRVWDDP